MTFPDMEGHDEMTMISRLPRVLALALAGGLLPGAAFAHPGHGAAEGLAAGVLHPLLGADHLLALLLAGVIAVRLGGRARLAIPGVVLAMMLAGGLLGASRLPLPGVEFGIALSVIAFGAVIAFDVRLPVGLAAVMAGLFALFHGYAHGIEIPETASGLAFGAGFALATVALLATGAGLAQLAFGGRRVGPAGALRLASAGAAVAGLSFVPGLI